MFLIFVNYVRESVRLNSNSRLKVYFRLGRSKNTVVIFKRKKNISRSLVFKNFTSKYVSNSGKKLYKTKEKKNKGKLKFEKRFM